ncbi:unnamed protein product, partial [Prorocentrum cordatum]
MKSMLVLASLRRTRGGRSLATIISSWELRLAETADYLLRVVLGVAPRSQWGPLRLPPASRDELAAYLRAVAGAPEVDPESEISEDDASPLAPPAALMRARCRACSDVIVGPSVVCDICLTDVHSHCVQPLQGHAVCFACFADRDVAYGRRQAAWSSGLAGQAAGAALGTAATGTQRLAVGAAAGARQTWAAGTMMPLPAQPQLPDQLSAAAAERAGRADAPDAGQDLQRPPSSAMDLQLAELRELRMEVQRLSRRSEQLEAERLADRASAAAAAAQGGASTPGYRTPVRGDRLDPGTPPSQASGGAERRPRTKQQSHLAEFRCLALRRQLALMACFSRCCRPADCRLGCLRSAGGPMDGQAGLQADRQEDTEVVAMEEVSEDLPEVQVVLAVIQGVADGADEQRRGAAFGLETVLAKLKDGDVPKLVFVAGANKAHAFEEWVQRASMRRFEYYLSRGPLERPLVKPNAEWFGADRHSLSIELRLRPLLLDSVPEQVQSGALATRQTSVTELLFGIMVEAGPGTLRDRTPVLREVERRDNKAAALALCYQELNSWKFSLTRLQRMAAPDPVTQLATLRGIATGMAEADANFRYRMFAWEMQRGISGASQCSQQQVEEFWRHLAAEARELCDAPQGKGVMALAATWETKEAKGGGKQGKPDATGGKPDARAKAKVKAKAKPAAKAATGGKETCRFFDSKAGCKFGATCTRHHRKLEVSEGKCFNCGAEDHDKAACPRPKPPAAAAAGGASAASAAAVAPAAAMTAEALQQVVRDAVAASLFPISAAAAAAGPAWQDGWGQPSGTPGSSAASAQAAAPPPQQQQQQPAFRTLQVDLRAARALLGGSGRRRLLADTGATHELQHLWPNQRPPVPGRRIDLAHATGQQAGVLMGADEVVYVHSPTELQALFPIGAYVAELSLDLQWGRDRASVLLPGQDAIELELEGATAYIYEDDAQRLRAMRQQLRARAGTRMPAAHFDVVVAAVQRLSRMRAHWRLDARTRPGGQLSVDISGPHPAGLWPGALPEDRPKRAQYFVLGAYAVMTASERAAAAGAEQRARDAAGAPPLAAAGAGERPADQGGQAAAAAAGQPLAADDAVAMVTRASALPAVAAVPADGPVEEEGVQTWYNVIPLAGKHTVEVLAALRLMIAQVELEFQARVVYRVHANQARELSGPKVSAALATQGIVVTSTPGHEADNNPRAERGIGIIKQRGRAMLMTMGAADREQPWLASVVYAAALQPREAQGKPIGCPIFGQPITCRIKQAPQFAFAPRAVPRRFFGICDFVSGASLVGHKVAQNGLERWEFETSSSFVVDVVPGGGARQEVNERGDQEEEKHDEEEQGNQEESEDLNPLRILDEAPREITCPACLEAHRGPTCDHRCRQGPSTERPNDHRRLRLRSKQAPAAAAAAADSDSDGVPDFVEIVKDSGMQPVSMTELRNSISTERDEWKLAMEAELASFAEKEVFEALTESEKMQVRTKDVLLMKGGCWQQGARCFGSGAAEAQEVPRGCLRNFQKQVPGEVVFTSNVEILSVRAALAIASSCGWALKALDVSAAFLNAPLPEDAGEALVRPPSILSSHGLVGRDEVWRAKKGIYGLRIALRAWGSKRDRQMRAMRFEGNGAQCRLVQSRCDACVWNIVEDVPTKTESEQKSLGLELVYVDDFWLAGALETIIAVEAVMMATWACRVQSLIDRAHPGTIRYLGLEVGARADGAFVAHQAAYLEDILAGWQMTNANACGTISIEPLGEELDAEPELCDVRLAQKLGGELPWLSGRARPDIAFAVSRMSAHATTAPRWALRLGKRIMRYLLGTRRHGLFFQAVRGDGNGLELRAFADASFETEYSQTGVAVYLGECLIDWRSVKQAQVARSTAEAEITALAMGLVMLEGAEASLAS